MKHVIYTKDKTAERLLSPSLRALVKKTVKTALDYEGFERDGEVSVTAVDEAEIQSLNKDWRGMDKVTDVLSFPATDDYDQIIPFDSEAVVLGDIIICMKKCFSQAEEYGHSAEREIAYLTAHSTLHLLGYDHMNDEEEKEMTRRQDEIVGILGL